MTFGVRNVVGILSSPPRAVHALLFRGYERWPAGPRRAFDYVLGCHVSHLLELLPAVAFYTYLWPQLFAQAATFSWRWVGPVLAFNFACEALFFGGWHLMMYAGQAAPVVTGKLAPFKYNPVNQYAPGTSNFWREVALTTLGWAQSAGWQCFMMWVWANKKWGVSTYEPFFSPTGDWRWNAWSIGSVLFIN